MDKQDNLVPADRMKCREELKKNTDQIVDSNGSSLRAFINREFSKNIRTWLPFCSLVAALIFVILGFIFGIASYMFALAFIALLWRMVELDYSLEAARISCAMEKEEERE